jgi:hypothetical protein
MKIRTNTQIPDWAVFGVLYGIIFGVSAFVLIRDTEGPTNWMVYALIIAAIAMGAVKSAMPRLRRA